MTLTLLNWNVWCDNGDLDRITEFIRASDADIICLQEVTESLCSKIAELPSYALVEARDSYHWKNGAKIPLLLVILSRLKIRRARAVKFRRQPKRSLIARFLGYEECLEFQYAEVVLPHPSGQGMPFRVFNAHLESVAGPKLRIARFAQVLRFLEDGKKNIICGDLNILRTWYSWAWRFIVGSWDELWMAEYEVFGKMFARRGFVNVFDGETTHAWSGSQLDYILVPNEMKVIRHTLFEDTHGSDHKPMLVELSLI